MDDTIPLRSSIGDPPQEADQTNEPRTPTQIINEIEERLSQHAQSTTASGYDWAALTDKALRFLSTASNETLGACLVGLGAGTYLVLGRVGLLLIGVVGGVVLHATWEGHDHQGGAGSRDLGLQSRRKELGADIAHRILDWRDSKRSKGDRVDDRSSDVEVRLFAGKELDFSEFRPETAAALTEFTHAVIRDYVKWWYSPILPSEELFPKASKQTLTAFLLSISAHVSRKRPADIFVDFSTRSSSFFIIIFQELSKAVLASPGDAASEAIDIYLKMKRDSTLANILDRNYQEKQFSVAADDILQNYLEPKTYNCMPARTFLHQILAKLILEMVLITCSKPEWINGWIEYLLQDGEPELMNAIDAGMDEPASQQIDNEQHIEAEDGTLGAAGIIESRRRERAVSKAQQAMDDAMQEAQRLSQMIADEDAKRLKDVSEASTTSLNDDISESTTQGVMTPSSSQSDAVADTETHALPKLENTFSQSGEVHIPFPLKSQHDTPKPEPKSVFTSFDQLIPNATPTAFLDESPIGPPPLTLHNCRITIFDDSLPGEKAMIRNRPNVEYLIQIEPSLDYYKGWMSAKRYSDFETLHEVLRRIAAVTGASGFIEAHKELPPWKDHTKPSLRNALERYINDAVRYKPLAESEGMKRFLDKEIGSGKSPGSGGIWPGQAFENMGKGMIDVLTKAPKEVAGGGKALFGGVTGVLGSVATPFGGAKAAKKVREPASTASPAPIARTTPPIQNRHGRAESTVSELPTNIRTESVLNMASRRTSTESARNANSPVIDQQPQREAPMERRPSYNPDGDGKRSGRSSVYGASRSNSRAPSVRESMDLSPTMGGDQILTLPPLPSEISDDYGAAAAARPSLDPFHSRNPSRGSTTSLSLANDPVPPLPRRSSAISLTSTTQTSPPKSRIATTTKSSPTQPTARPKPHQPLSEQETTVLIELLFAVINELYTLSSAWSLRRTLLNAAKTFLLRPGNPQLTSIQTLLQTTVLDANTSDAGLAYHLRKLRANTLPTEEELKMWPKEMPQAEKEQLRVRARKLAVERGMPQALTSVMGNAASGEAVGKVFDALQVESVARGVMFGLVLQGLRGLTQ